MALGDAAKRGAAVVALAAAGLIASFEGTRHTAYLDAVGIPTICTGHTGGVKLGQTASAAVCRDLLSKDATKAAQAVLRRSKVPITMNEAAAYTSFVFNTGEGNFASSTLLRKLNAGDHTGACNELLRWDRAKGVVLRGLSARRRVERDLCLTPDKP